MSDERPESDDDREVETGKDGHVEKVLSPSDDPDLPTPKVDEDVDRAPGGADATASESDVGAGSHSSDELLTNDQPLSAQTQETDIPDAIQEGESGDEPSSDGASDPETEEPA